MTSPLFISVLWVVTKTQLPLIAVAYAQPDRLPAACGLPVWCRPVSTLTTEPIGPFKSPSVAISTAYRVRPRKARSVTLVSRRRTPSAFPREDRSGRCSPNPSGTRSRSAPDGVGAVLALGGDRGRDHDRRPGETGVGSADCSRPPRRDRDTPPAESIRNVERSESVRVCGRPTGQRRRRSRHCAAGRAAHLRAPLRRITAPEPLRGGGAPASDRGMARLYSLAECPHGALPRLVTDFSPPATLRGTPGCQRCPIGHRSGRSARPSRRAGRLPTPRAEKFGTWSSSAIALGPFSGWPPIAPRPTGGPTRPRQPRLLPGQRARPC